MAEQYDLVLRLGLHEADLNTLKQQLEGIVKAATAGARGSSKSGGSRSSANKEAKKEVEGLTAAIEEEVKVLKVVERQAKLTGEGWEGASKDATNESKKFAKGVRGITESYNDMGPAARRAMDDLMALENELRRIGAIKPGKKIATTSGLLLANDELSLTNMLQAKKNFRRIAANAEKIRAAGFPDVSGPPLAVEHYGAKLREREIAETKRLAEAKRLEAEAQRNLNKAVNQAPKVTDAVRAETQARKALAQQVNLYTSTGRKALTFQNALVDGKFVMGVNESKNALAHMIKEANRWGGADGEAFTRNAFKAEQALRTSGAAGLMADKTFRNLSSRFGPLGTGLNLLAESFGRLVGKVLQWTVATGAVFAIIGGFRALYKTIIEIDTAMAGLTKVIPNNDVAKANELLQEAAHSAATFGAKITDVIAIQTDLVRKGYDVADVVKIQNVALLGMNIAELSAEESTKFLSSAIIEFNLNANDAIKILDVYNELSNRVGVATKDIAAGVSRAGASYHQLGGNLQELAALIAYISKVSARSGKEIGTVFRMVFTRIYRPEILKKLQEQFDIKLFKAGSGGKDLIPIGQALGQLAAKYQTLSTAQQQFFADTISGGQRINELKLTLANYDEVLKAQLISYQSLGSAQKENEIYVNTLQVAFKRLAGAGQELAATIGRGAGLADAILGLTNIITNFTRSIAESKIPFEWIIRAISDFGTSLLLWKFGIPFLQSAVAWLIKLGAASIALPGIIKQFGLLATVWKSLQVALGIGAAGEGALAVLGPVGLAVAGGTALVALAKHFFDVSKAQAGAAASALKLRDAQQLEFETSYNLSKTYETQAQLVDFLTTKRNGLKKGTEAQKKVDAELLQVIRDADPALTKLISKNGEYGRVLDALYSKSEKEKQAEIDRLIRQKHEIAGKIETAKAHIRLNEALMQSDDLMAAYVLSTHTTLWDNVVKKVKSASQEIKRWLLSEHKSLFPEVAPPTILPENKGGFWSKAQRDGRGFGFISTRGVAEANKKLSAEQRKLFSDIGEWSKSSAEIDSYLAQLTGGKVGVATANLDKLSNKAGKAHKEATAGIKQTGAAIDATLPSIKSENQALDDLNTRLSALNENMSELKDSHSSLDSSTSDSTYFISLMALEAEKAAAAMKAMADAEAALPKVFKAGNFSVDREGDSLEKARAFLLAYMTMRKGELLGQGWTETAEGKLIKKQRTIALPGKRFPVGTKMHPIPVGLTGVERTNAEFENLNKIFEQMTQAMGRQKAVSDAVNSALKDVAKEGRSVVADFLKPGLDATNELNKAQDSLAAKLEKQKFTLQDVAEEIDGSVLPAYATYVRELQKTAQDAEKKRADDENYLEAQKAYLEDLLQIQVALNKAATSRTPEAFAALIVSLKSIGPSATSILEQLSAGQKSLGELLPDVNQKIDAQQAGLGALVDTANASRIAASGAAKSYDKSTTALEDANSAYLDYLVSVGLAANADEKATAHLEGMVNLFTQLKTAMLTSKDTEALKELLTKMKDLGFKDMKSLEGAIAAAKIKQGLDAIGEEWVDKQKEDQKQAETDRLKALEDLKKETKDTYTEIGDIGKNETNKAIADIKRQAQAYFEMTQDAVAATAWKNARLQQMEAEFYQKQKEEVKSLADSIQQDLTGAFADAIMGKDGVTEALRQMSSQLVSDTIKRAITESGLLGGFTKDMAGTLLGRKQLLDSAKFQSEIVALRQFMVGVIEAPMIITFNPAQAEQEFVNAAGIQVKDYNASGLITHAQYTNGLPATQMPYGYSPSPAASMTDILGTMSNPMYVKDPPKEASAKSQDAKTQRKSQRNQTVGYIGAAASLAMAAGSMDKTSAMLSGAITGWEVSGGNPLGALGGLILGGIFGGSGNSPGSKPQATQLYSPQDLLYSAPQYLPYSAQVSGRGYVGGQQSTSNNMVVTMNINSSYDAQQTGRDIATGMQQGSLARNLRFEQSRGVSRSVTPTI